jgi:hypothetical protein
MFPEVKAALDAQEAIIDGEIVAPFSAWVTSKHLSSPLRTRRGPAVLAAPVFTSLPPCCGWFIDGLLVSGVGPWGVDWWAPGFLLYLRA